MVTPFESPQVRTTSDTQTQIKGNVVYVATDKNHRFHFTSLRLVRKRPHYLSP